MDFLVDLLNNVFSWLPDSVEGLVESRLPFDDGDGHLEVNDFDPTKNESVNKVDIQAYEFYDSVGKKGKELISSAFETANPNYTDEIIENLGGIVDIGKKFL